ncbi:MAG: DDE-type integrase/transposase/recombinase, partial [Nitrospira sp.]|nr:DDE-type integrase/transposase/recombinase [Nitrospira sp.]
NGNSLWSPESGMFYKKRQRSSPRLHGKIRHDSTLSHDGSPADDVSIVARLPERLLCTPGPSHWHHESTGARCYRPRANTKWVTDITSIATQEGWLYLAVVLDLFLRQVIGWSKQLQLTRDLVIPTELMAVWQRSNTEPVILYSDRGTQYTAQEFQTFLKAHGIVSSMSGVGNGGGREFLWLAQTGTGPSAAIQNPDRGSSRPV